MVGAKVLTILSMAGRYSKPVQCGRESAHKNWAQGGLASLDVYMYGQQHLHQGEVQDYQRGLREVSCCTFFRQFFSVSAYFFLRQHLRVPMFCGRLVFVSANVLSTPIICQRLSFRMRLYFCTFYLRLYFCVFCQRLYFCMRQ